jgi:hypothetical protein
MTLTFISLILDSGVVSPGSGAFPYFVAAQNGLSSALCVSLLINGFVGFQLYEDGTTLSVWLLRLCSVGMFVLTGAISLLTFKGWAGLSPTKTVGLFVVLYIFNGIFLLVYLIMQILLVTNTLQDRWPIGDIVFGVFFFVIGQVILYALGSTICDAAGHYLDGLFFATVCNLLAVMMIYKVRTVAALGVTTFANLATVLGFHHQRRSRIQRRNQNEQLGSQGTFLVRRRPTKYTIRRTIRVQQQPLRPTCTSSRLGLRALLIAMSHILYNFG